MANVNAPFGFRPVMHINGSPWNGQTNLYYIPSTDTSTYFLGDVVKSAAGADGNGVPACQLAAGTDTVRGVVVGLLPVYPGTSMKGTTLTLEQISLPATKTQAYYALVADAPDLVCEVQVDADAGNHVIAANMNKNATFTVATPSDTTFPLSASVVTSASIATTNTLNLKLRGLVRDPLNAFGAYARVLVSFNLHELNAAGTTAI